MLHITGSQLVFLLFCALVVVALIGGAWHNETGNPKSHGRVAYGIPLLLLFFLVLGAFWHLGLGHEIMNSFGTEQAMAVEPAYHPLPKKAPVASRSRAVRHSSSQDQGWVRS